MTMIDREKAPAVRFGVYVNNRAAVFAGDGQGFGLDAMLGLAGQAESYDFDFVAVGDSVLAKPRYSPIVALSAIAARTERIGITTGILQPHVRNPVLLAQEWATLDAVSEGRSWPGVGLGTGRRDLVDAELELAGLTRRRRARAFEESIILLKRLWAGGPVEFDGVCYQLDDIDMGFGAVQPGGPPISIACGGFVATKEGHGPNDFFTPENAGKFVGPLDRVGRLGDGWITGIATPQEWRASWEQIVESARTAGRDVEGPGFERRLNCFVNVGEEAASRREGQEFLEAYHRLPMDEETLDRWLIAGSPETCAERISAYVEAGLNSFQFVLASVDQERQLKLLSEQVLPAVRSASRAGQGQPA